VLLPQTHSWIHDEDSFVSLSQSANRSQIFVGDKLSRQFGLRPGMADNVELINVTSEIIKIERLKLHGKKQ